MSDPPWVELVAAGSGMGNARSGRWSTVAIALTVDERAELERIAQLRVAPYREVIRARAVLLAAAGARNGAIGQAVGVSDRTVVNWRKDFVARRLAALRDRPRAGRRRRFSPLGTRGGDSCGVPETGW